VSRPLRQSAKGGYHECMRNRLVRKNKSYVGSIAAHPCKKRKDGAPSVGLVQCEDGPTRQDVQANAVVPLSHVALDKSVPCSRK
jgi:hypothetical protein